MIGIFLPRFLYKDKVVVGSYHKFKEFTGWELAEGTAMNLGIIGDLYLNFGKKYGIIMGLVFGLLLGFTSQKYIYSKLFTYPDLIFWSVLFYFMIMRAGNEFYIIMNWYFKTIVIVAIFLFICETLRIKKASFF